MRSCEKLLEGFEPVFEFKPNPPVPKEEFLDRASRIRTDAAEDGCDALILHSDMMGWYHPSNSYLRKRRREFEPPQCPGAFPG